MRTAFVLVAVLALAVSVSARLNAADDVQPMMKLYPSKKAPAKVEPNMTAADAESCSFMTSLVESHFSGDTNIWLCIAFRESSYNPSARNPFSGATGLFQVETIHCGNMAGCPPAGSGCVSGLEDPNTNANCARSVYNAQGFGAWTTYPACASGGGPCQV